MKAFLGVLLLVAAVLAENENQCPTDWTVEKLLSHEDCNKFQKCTFGKPVEQKCPEDLYFNLDNWQCDWPANVDCAGRKDPADKSAEAPVASKEENIPESEQAPEESEQAPEGSEQTPEEPEHSPEESEQGPEQPENNPEESGQASEESEQAPEKPEAKESEEDCDDESEEQQPELEFQDNGCPVNPDVHWLLPHEDDCNQFYYCITGEKQLRNCPASLHFNRQLQVCDWPAEAGCAVSANKHLGGRASAFQNQL